MKNRLIVAAIGITALLLILFLAPLWVFGVFVAAVAAMGVWEFTRCAAKALPVRIRCLCMLPAAVVPLSAALELSYALSRSALLLLMLYLTVELLLSFRREEPYPLADICAAALCAGIFPLMLSALVRLGVGEHSAARLLLPFVITFSCDSGAYFVGSAMGKHKFAPHVSPNKSLEGCIGGFAAGILAAAIYGLVLRLVGIQIQFPVMLLYGFLGSVVCEIGDLAFSAAKRLCGIKDYGSLLPGHGGILDRFDSLMFVAPLIEILMLWTPAIL